MTNASKHKEPSKEEFHDATNKVEQDENVLEESFLNLNTTHLKIYMRRIEKK